MVRSQHQIIEQDRTDAFPEADEIIEFRRYYAGDQIGTHTTQQAKTLYGLLNHRYCDNVCATVVNTVAGRCILEEWQVDDEVVAEFLDELWTKNWIRALQAEVHIQTLHDGNMALGLQWHSDPPTTRGSGKSAARQLAGRVTIHREPWWDGESGMFCAYNPDGSMAYAVKDWTERTAEGDKLKRRTIWFPDHIERWAQQGDGWGAVRLDSDPVESADGIVPWVRRDGTPLGIPVVHFAAGSTLGSRYGLSILDGGVLGLQDEVNDVQRDITAAARLTAFQMITATGSTPQTDSAGNSLPLNVGPGNVLQSPDPNTRYGVIPAGNLGQINDALMVKTRTICRMTDVPLHVITGEWPSGTALMRSEMPLVGRAGRFDNTVAPSWATVAHRSTEMANTFGEGVELDEDALITAIFAAPEQPDALTDAQTQLAQAQALVEREKLQDRLSYEALGLTEQEIDDILGPREKAAKAAADRQASLLGALQGPGQDVAPPAGPTGPTGNGNVAAPIPQRVTA